MYKVGIIYDRTEKSLGGHGVHCAFQGLPGVDQVALVDKCQEADNNRQALGAKRLYGDYVEMMDTEKPDIVVLGSRTPSSHIQPVEEAAKRGIHILSEKPLCGTLEEADRMAMLTEKYHVKIAVTHLARYSLIFRKMKELIEAGEIGMPISVYGRGKEDERGGGEDMIVLGTHILDAMCFLFGKPEHLFSEVLTGGQPLKSTDRSQTKEPVGHVAGDNVFAHLHFPNQVRGFFESRKNIFKPNGQVRMGITVVGTDGALSMRYTNGSKEERTLRLTHSPYPAEDASDYEIVKLEETRVIPGAEPINYSSGFIPYFLENNRYAAWDLLHAIKEDCQPIANVYDTINVLELIQGIYISQLNGCRITLPLAQRRHPLEM